MEKTEIRQRKVARRLPPGVKPIKKKELFTGRAPDVFEWGWTKMPMVSRVLISGTFLTMVAFGVPYWAHVDWDGEDSGHFGLFVYCPGELQSTCTSIHDNLVPDRDVPLWYHFTQVSYFIGGVCGALGMFVVYSNHEGRYLVIPPTTKNMALLMITVGVIQLSISIYTFYEYLDHTDFLYQGHSEVNFHASFFCAVFGNFFYAVGIFMLLLHDERSVPPPSLRTRLSLIRRQLRDQDAAAKERHLNAAILRDQQRLSANTQQEQPDARIRQEDVAALRQRLNAMRHGGAAGDASAFQPLNEMKYLQQQIAAQNTDANQGSRTAVGLNSGPSWSPLPAGSPSNGELPMGQTLVKVVDPDSVYHYTAQDYIVKHTGDQDLDLETLARATGGRNYTPKHTDPPPPYTEKDEATLRAEREARRQREAEEERRRRQEERRKALEKKREEERRKEAELPPWVRYHEARTGGAHAHKHCHCQCIHTHQWMPVSAQIIANQPHKVGSGPTIKEIN